MDMKINGRALNGTTTLDQIDDLGVVAGELEGCLVSLRDTANSDSLERLSELLDLAVSGAHALGSIIRDCCIEAYNVGNTDNPDE